MSELERVGSFLDATEWAVRRGPSEEADAAAPTSKPSLSDRALVLAEVPERFRALWQSCLADTPAVRHVRDWLDADGLTLTLLGPSAAGKTTAATLAVAELGREVEGARTMADRRPARYLSCVDLSAWGAWSRDGDAERGDRSQYLDPRLLVLDDLGWEPNGGQLGESAKAFVRWLVFRRHADKRKTIVLSNLAIEDLTARYEAPMMRRLLGTEDRSAHHVVMDRTVAQ